MKQLVQLNLGEELEDLVLHIEYEELQIIIDSSEDYTEATFRQALQDLEDTYQNLMERRFYWKEAFREDDLLSWPNYLQPFRRQLTDCHQWINSNFTNAQTLNLQQPTDDDVTSITSSAHPENIGQLGKQLASVVALSFDVTKHVMKFNGNQINRYPGWKS